MIELAHLFDARILLEPVMELGATPLGRRRIIPIAGGSFEGARMKGRIVPGGADWQYIRDDGTAVLDARYTLETDDGALIYIVNFGYRHGPPEVIERLVRGEAVDPASYYFRTVPHFETAAGTYDWLNRTVCVGTARRNPDSVELEVHEVK